MPNIVELERAYLLEAFGICPGQCRRCLIRNINFANEQLPASAYLKGYSFVEFDADCGDPYALVAPDGRVLKVWLGKPPSLTEVWDKL